MKFRLSFTVAFSSALGYMLGESRYGWNQVFILWLGGIMVTGSANIINQILEKNLDSLMKRTAKRPLPTQKISVLQAGIFSFLLGSIGLMLIGYYFNSLAALLSLISLIIYGFIYTPLKLISPICVFIGAIAGGLPPMIGYIAATGLFGWEAGLLFGIQFIWQFPHFWSIAWVLDDDYRLAGFKMLPTAAGKSLKAATQIMLYTLLLIPLGLLPFMIGMTGKTSAMIALVCGILFLMHAFYLMKTQTERAARNIMLCSFLYLPIVLMAYVLDKI